MALVNALAPVLAWLRLVAAAGLLVVAPVHSVQAAEAIRIAVKRAGGPQIDIYWRGSAAAAPGSPIGTTSQRTWPVRNAVISTGSPRNQHEWILGRSFSERTQITQGFEISIPRWYGTGSTCSSQPEITRLRESGLAAKSYSEVLGYALVLGEIAAICSAGVKPDDRCRNAAAAVADIYENWHATVSGQYFGYYYEGPPC